MHYCLAPTTFHTPKRPWGDPYVIATGYFDGETEGFLQCGLCDQTYHFVLLDWDEGQDRRIFSLSRLEAPRFEEITELLVETYGERRKPYWVPHNPTVSDETRRSVLHAIGKLIGSNVVVESILLSEHIEREVMSLVVLEERKLEDIRDLWAVLKSADRA